MKTIFIAENYNEETLFSEHSFEDLMNTTEHLMPNSFRTAEVSEYQLRKLREKDADGAPLYYFKNGKVHRNY